mmetsp:Transcript_33114/g.92758  ORF Transcript_33114/g.92758 Transcript_33114/m.92758 type:complete len:378 (-) Transcript_33114:475-1608(-)
MLVGTVTLHRVAAYHTQQVVVPQELPDGGVPKVVAASAQAVGAEGHRLPLDRLPGVQLVFLGLILVERVRPQDVAERSVLRGLLVPHDLANVVQRAHRRPDSRVDAEQVAVGRLDQACQREGVKGRHEGVENPLGVLVQTLLVEVEVLSNHAALVVPPKEVYRIGVTDLQSVEVEDDLSREASAVHVVTQKEELAIRAGRPADELAERHEVVELPVNVAHHVHRGLHLHHVRLRVQQLRRALHQVVAALQLQPALAQQVGQEKIDSRQRLVPLALEQLLLGQKQPVRERYVRTHPIGLVHFRLLSQLLQHLLLLLLPLLLLILLGSKGGKVLLLPLLAPFFSLPRPLQTLTLALCPLLSPAQLLLLQLPLPLKLPFL